MESQTPPSEFNMSIPYLNRLNAILIACDEASMQLNAFQWYHAIATLYRELSTEIKQIERVTIQETLSQLNTKISKQASVKHMSNTIPKELYFELNDLEILLRQVMKDRGLMLKVSADPSKALMFGGN